MAHKILCPFIRPTKTVLTQIYAYSRHLGRLAEDSLKKIKRWMIEKYAVWVNEIMTLV